MNTKESTIEQLKIAVLADHVSEIKKIMDDTNSAVFINLSSLNEYYYIAKGTHLDNAANCLEHYKINYSFFLEKFMIDNNHHHNNFFKENFVTYLKNGSIFDRIKKNDINNENFTQDLLIKCCMYGNNNLLLFLIEHLIEKKQFHLTVNNDLLEKAVHYNQEKTVQFLLYSPELIDHCENIYCTDKRQKIFTQLPINMQNTLLSCEKLAIDTKAAFDSVIKNISDNALLLERNLTAFLNNQQFMSYKDYGKNIVEYVFIEACDKRSLEILTLLATNELFKKYLTQDMVRVGLLRCNTLNGLGFERFEEITDFLMFSPLLPFHANAALNKYSDLLLSCELGDLPKVKKLLSRPDLCLIDVNQCGAFSKCCQYNQLEIVQYMVETPYLNADPHANGLLLFSFAINNGHTDIVKYLALCPPNEKHKSYLNYSTLLFQAANRNMRELIDFFLSEPSIKKYTFIHYQEDIIFNSVVDNGNTELIDYFIVDYKITLTKHIEHHFNTPGIIVPDSQKKIDAISYAKKLFSLRQLNEHLHNHLPDKTNVKAHKVKI